MSDQSCAATLLLRRRPAGTSEPASGAMGGISGLLAMRNADCTDPGRSNHATHIETSSTTRLASYATQTYAAGCDAHTSCILWASRPPMATRCKQCACKLDRSRARASPSERCKLCPHPHTCTRPTRHCRSQGMAKPPSRHGHAMRPPTQVSASMGALELGMS